MAFARAFVRCQAGRFEGGEGIIWLPGKLLAVAERVQRMVKLPAGTLNTMGRGAGADPAGESG